MCVHARASMPGLIFFHKQKILEILPVSVWCVLSVVISIITITKTAFIHIRMLLLKFIFILHCLKSSYVPVQCILSVVISILIIFKITIISNRMLPVKFIILLQCFKSCYQCSVHYHNHLPYPHTNPHINRGGGGCILESLCPSIRLSIHPPVRVCLDDIS